MHTYIHTHRYKYKHIYTCVCVYMHMHQYMYTHAHVHTQILQHAVPWCSCGLVSRAHVYALIWGSRLDDGMCDMTCLIHMCDMAHSYVCRDSFMCAAWLIWGPKAQRGIHDRSVHMRSYARHVTFIRVMWLIYGLNLDDGTFAMTNLYVWHYSFVRHNVRHNAATHCSTLQHTATHCNTLQHTLLIRAT